MIRVGSQIPGLRGKPEGIAVEGPGVWVIHVLVDKPTPREVVGIARGHVDLCMDGHGPALLWMLRAGGPWSAAAWPWWEARPTSPPPLPAGVGGVAQVILGNVRTGRCEALRSVGFTVAVARHVEALHAAAEAAGRDEEGWQAALRWTRESTQAELVDRARGAAVVTGVPAKGAS